MTEDFFRRDKHRKRERDMRKREETVKHERERN